MKQAQIQALVLTIIAWNLTMNLRGTSKLYSLTFLQHSTFPSVRMNYHATTRFSTNVTAAMILFQHLHCYRISPSKTITLTAYHHTSKLRCSHTNKCKHNMYMYKSFHHVHTREQARARVCVCVYVSD